MGTVTRGEYFEIICIHLSLSGGTGLFRFYGFMGFRAGWIAMHLSGRSISAVFGRLMRGFFSCFAHIRRSYYLWRVRRFIVHLSMFLFSFIALEGFDSVKAAVCMVRRVILLLFCFFSLVSLYQQYASASMGF